MTVETFVVVVRCSLPECGESTTITSTDGPVFAELIAAHVRDRGWAWHQTPSAAVCPACVRRIARR